jgi:mRNA interferase MazF
MEKDFDRWNEQKKLLNTKNEKFFFKEGEIWWCSIGMNVGAESYGKGQTFNRPVLVLKRLSSDSFIGIPLSTKPKIGSWYVQVIFLGEKSIALLHQIKMFSASRFQRRMAKLNNEDFARVKEKLEALLKLS